MKLKVSVEKEGNRIQLPVVIDKEDKWLVARVPMLGLATQGKTLKEVKENIVDLLNLYFENPHTPKPELQSLSNIDVILTTVTLVIPEGAINDQARAVATT
ncbi:MAG: hypothetical protein COY38_01880 [Candidatus Aenigmarchaeota archaeon CG_4_10_14_0_8_um_filter_37_24]|nr:type II toxin-antitoxin system HicB family antitoxin [Candidatus Aenigmarchaeota archaeon]OIN87797.1 MAG: hypothetical protein AUJ50_02455 [Candidatus Aenigmarchaeota archaeon CG1_02_38_14]PIV69369.1 MAG: hypothetical protein COS07_01015 [Candidatus Aenigmarchaeota archaeon CG01_land_8_20_14_3_00_37_9]PIW41423.1 MAG: hypothetical protein COW21_01980 [Candidatus Aenigmarchaeota archaeon CG15_BIG_FIL_POST_REV_8_21_14_020_37_27]PIY36333.1 MAG: hypothetical protein COZ04_00675 [Candidatus Aenigm